MVVLEVVVPGSWIESEDRASGVDEAVVSWRECARERRQNVPWQMRRTSL